MVEELSNKSRWVVVSQGWYNVGNHYQTWLGTSLALLRHFIFYASIVSIGSDCCFESLPETTQSQETRIGIGLGVKRNESYGGWGWYRTNVLSIATYLKIEIPGKAGRLESIFLRHHIVVLTARSQHPR